MLARGTAYTFEIAKTKEITTKKKAICAARIQRIRTLSAEGRCPPRRWLVGWRDRRRLLPDGCYWMSMTGQRCLTGQTVSESHLPSAFIEVDERLLVVFALNNLNASQRARCRQYYRQ